MLKAASLIYAILISLLIAVVCSSFILSAFYNEQYILETIIRNQLLSDSQSGINLLLSNQQEVLPDETKLVDLFDDGEHMVELKRMSWGVFEVIGSLASKKNHSHHKMAISGANIMEEKEVALYLADGNKPLALCGKTLLKGNCYLPEAGVKRAYIEGQNFTGKALIDGSSYTSKNQLPALNALLVEASTYYLENLSKPTDSIIDFDELNGDSVINSFANRTLLVHSKGFMRLSNLYLEGNIVLRSDQAITFGSSCQTEDILAYAPKITIEKGFEGSLQLYASDSIAVAETCTLHYPSSLALVNTKRGEGKYEILIGENTVVEGAVFLHHPYQTRRSEAYLSIGKDALVSGQVYCDEHVELKGKIYGSLYCKAFILKTPSSIYENHLLNAEIDRSALPEDFVGIPLLEPDRPKKIVKWLN